MIFVDTGAWIALTDKSDQYHHQAVTRYNRLRHKKRRFLTTDYVFDETVTRLRYDAGHRFGVQFMELMNQSIERNILQFEIIDTSLFSGACDIFRMYDTAHLSFTDCTSFAVCRKYGISTAFAFDKHFTMMGISIY